MTPNPAAEARPVYTFGPFRLDVAERRLLREGAEIALTRKTFDLLLTLIEGAGRLRTREALIHALWPDTIVEEHSLTWHLSTLRRALGDVGASPSYVETVRGHGYRFIAPVETLAAGVLAPAPPSAAAAETPEPSTPKPRAPRAALVLAGVLGIVALAFAVALARRPANRDTIGVPTAPVSRAGCATALPRREARETSPPDLRL